MKTTSTLQPTMRLGTHLACPWRAYRALGKRFLAGVVVTDLDTEHGATDANKRDGARQRGRLNVAHLDL